MSLTSISSVVYWMEELPWGNSTGNLLDYSWPYGPLPIPTCFLFISLFICFHLTLFIAIDDSGDSCLTS